VQSIPALTALFVHADWIGKEANRDHDEIRNTPSVHTFAAVFVLAGIAHRVRLIVKETNAGYRFHDHDMIEHKKPADPELAASLPKEGATTSEPAGSDRRISDPHCAFQERAASDIQRSARSMLTTERTETASTGANRDRASV